MNLSTGNITIQDIAEALKLELPGDFAHQRMLPEGRSLNIPLSKSGKVKESAVLVFMLLKNNELNFCLTRRNPNMKHHPGQISFPGGAREENDSSIYKTALRELEEETGVDKTKVKIIGKLSDLYISVSNFLIHPVVGYLDYEPEFRIDPHEVEELIFIPVKFFLAENNVTFCNIDSEIGSFNVPCYKIDDWIIWGATAMIIAEFKELLTNYFPLKAKYSDNENNDPTQLKQN